MKIITTPWGTKQYEIEGQPMLSREDEAVLRQEWRTPPEFWEELDEEFHFQLDAAASEHNHLTEKYLSSAEDALADGTRWIIPEENVLRVYCNPGFSDMGLWLEKAEFEVAQSPSAIVCVLGLCAPSTGWWEDALNRVSEIRLLAPRVQFEPPDPRIPRSSNARENALFVFRGGAPLATGLTITWRWK
jgi:site-specific DNA-methyltransferase (adenine-specific)